MAVASDNCSLCNEINKSSEESRIRFYYLKFDKTSHCQSNHLNIVINDLDCWSFLYFYYKWIIRNLIAWNLESKSVSDPLKIVLRISDFFHTTAHTWSHTIGKLSIYRSKMGRLVRVKSPLLLLSKCNWPNRLDFHVVKKREF